MDLIIFLSPGTIIHYPIYGIYTLNTTANATITLPSTYYPEGVDMVGQVITFRKTGVNSLPNVINIKAPNTQILPLNNVNRVAVNTNTTFIAGNAVIGRVVLLPADPSNISAGYIWSLL